MGYNAKVGSFNLDSAVTAGNDQSVTGAGFLPELVLFWWSGSTATGDSVAGGDYCLGFGAAISSSSRRSAGASGNDADADSNNWARQYTDNCIAVFDGDGTVGGVADFSSMDADGFTLTIDDQFTVDYRVSYLALGGTDLTDVYIGSQQMPAAPGNYNITGVGFQPDAVLLFGMPGTAEAQGGASAMMFLGMATGSSEQGVVMMYAWDAAATTDTYGYGYNGEVTARWNSWRSTFVNFGADGFTLNQLEGINNYYYYVCLKGGQYAVGDLTTRTDGNDIEENVGFEPAAVLFASANRAHSTQDARTAHSRISIGAGTATDERAVQAISDEDDLADTETAFTNQDDAVYAHVKDDVIEALMDIKSIDADGFTCVMDDTETAGCWVTYLAIGAEAAATLSVSESESVTVSDSITMALAALGISEADSMTAQDAATVSVQELVEDLNIAIVPTDSTYDIAKPIIIG